MMKDRNRKNHESAFRKVVDSAQKIGIKALTKITIKTAIERYIAENSLH